MSQSKRKKIIEFFNKNLEFTQLEFKLKVVVFIIYYHNLQSSNSIRVIYKKTARFNICFYGESTVRVKYRNQTSINLNVEQN